MLDAGGWRMDWRMDGWIDGWMDGWMDGRDGAVSNESDEGASGVDQEDTEAAVLLETSMQLLLSVSFG